jgi:transketolase
MTSAATIQGTDQDLIAINAIRTLTIDAIAAANSGHPGAAMALAPVGHAVWNHAMRYDVSDPRWINRDRFVLSAGHASMLLYSLLHLARVRSAAGDRHAIELDDIRRFRRLGSRCAGHPEYGLADGIECTTGPLGTGIAASVGMAIAGQWYAARFNRPGYPIFGYNVYAVASDGDLMEGIGQEAASLAAHLRLDNLCWIYDSNDVTIEGGTSLAFTENVAHRFRAYGWHVAEVADANDARSVRDALDKFSAQSGAPTLIIVHSIIGYGAPTKQGTAAAHSDPLGDREARAAKRFYGWPEDAPFSVPDEAYQSFAAGAGAHGKQAREQWDAIRAAYRIAYPELDRELDTTLGQRLPPGWEADLPLFDPQAGPVAGRDANRLVLNAVAARAPWIIGGSADLAPSTRAALDGRFGDFGPADYAGRTLHFGVREAAAAAVANGLALSGLRPFQAGFLVFSDFQRGPVRLSALMRQPVIHVYTHDSISMGEDGPTHQPVEHLAGLRAIPGLVDIRPADANEVTGAWRAIMGIGHRPVALVLSKQATPVLPGTNPAALDGVARGGYVLIEPPMQPRAVIIATGSEVALAVAAQEILAAQDVAVRVVSMPSWALFADQDQAYRDAVLPPVITARVAVEQASPLGWERFAGDHGTIIGMTSFGASGPGDDVRAHFGFTPAAIAEAVLQTIEQTIEHGRSQAL